MCDIIKSVNTNYDDVFGKFQIDSSQEPMPGNVKHINDAE